MFILIHNYDDLNYVKLTYMKWTKSLLIECIEVLNLEMPNKKSKKDLQEVLKKYLHSKGVKKCSCVDLENIVKNVHENILIRRFVR